jgi:predicted nucleic acid-binding protein
MKLLIDSNIIIYLVTDKNQKISKFLSGNELHCSVISYIEVLGYYKLDNIDKANFEKFLTILICCKSILIL